MPLKKISLTNFCGFKNFTLELDRFTVLVGRNNCGKTTLLRALKMACDATRFIPSNARSGNIGTNWLEEAARGFGFESANLLVAQKSQGNAMCIELLLGVLGAEFLFQVLRTSPQETRAVIVPPDQSDAFDLWMQERRPHFPKAEFIPPPGSIQSREQLMPMTNFRSMRANGQFDNSWRNEVHWLWEGKSPEKLQEVINRVRESIDGINLLPPQRSLDGQYTKVHYQEEDSQHEISASGAGLRTLVTLATEIQLSDATVLLFDEPDSHLHSSVQRKMASFLDESAHEDRQIVVATHAPDFIEAVPVESLVWIDKANSCGQRCDEVGKIMVDLGAVSHTAALEFVGANIVLCFEATPDGQVLARVFDRCGKVELLSRARIQNLRGFGDASKLPGALNLLRGLRNTKIAVAAILDADYTELSPIGSSSEKGGVLFVRLPCKELENLLLLSPAAIAKAAQKEADRRQGFSGTPARYPTLQEVEQKIDECSAGNDIKQKLIFNWIRCWSESTGTDLHGPGNLEQAQKEFEVRWNDSLWRRRCCPGKLVLRKMRQWLKDNFVLNLGLSGAFDDYEPDPEFRKLLDDLDLYVKKSLS